MIFADRVKETTTATSMATIPLAGASAGYRAFAAALTVGATGVSVCTVDTVGNWELALYTLTSAALLTRTSILASSNAGAAVTFPAGTKDVFSTVPTDYMTGQTIAQLQDGGTAQDSDIIEISRGGVSMRLTRAAFLAGASTAPVTATVSSVAVSPTSASVAGGAAQTFTATVTGTNSPAQTVTWSATAGSITSGGVFTAPTATSSAQSITITATSTVDTSKSGTATATIAASGSTVSGVTVTPTPQSVTGTTTQQFTATVAGTNSPSQSVTWGASAGTINSSGLFTAPSATTSAQTITITATSAQDNTKAGTATVTIPVAVAPGAPTIGTAVAGDGYVDVAFTPSASNGGAPVTLRTATLSTGETATGTNSPIRVTATNGTARTAHVTATNSAGLTGAASAESNSVTPAGATATSYTIIGYGGTQKPPATVDASVTTNDGGKKRVVNRYTTYYTFTPMPASAVSGWGTSNTVPPSTITAAENYNSAASINGMVPMSGFNANSMRDDSCLWVATGSGTSTWYLWIKPVDGAAFCFNASTGTVVSGA